MKKIILFLLTALCTGLPAQTLQSEKNKLTGILNEDSRAVMTNYNQYLQADDAETAGRKSPILAGLMSAVIPGAGELYTKHYWKAALFVAIEAAAIGISVHYNKKGDDATIEFKNYADEHWSMVRYAEWLNKYAKQLQGGENAPTIEINSNTNLKHWERVDLKQIHAVEGLIKSFSHRLETHGEQQYYELIGKYKQYSQGWDETKEGTPDYLKDVPQQIYFSEMFVKPDNTYYKYADQAITVLLLNHLVSTVDAVLSANSYNKSLKMSVGMQKTDLTGQREYYPEFRMSVRF